MKENKQSQQNICAQYSCYEPEMCPLWGTDATPCAKRNKCDAWEGAMKVARLEDYNDWVIATMQKGGAR